MLKIEHKHSCYDPTDCTKFQDCHISIKKVIQKFEGEKQKVRILYFGVFFWVREYTPPDATH